MKNDILLFAVMFATAWIGFTVAKERLTPTSIVSHETVADEATSDATDLNEAAPSARASLSSPTDSASATAVAQKSADEKTNHPNKDSQPKDVASTPKTKSHEAQSAEPKSAQQQIEQVLIEQVKAWNQGDLDGFMDAYWNDEALTISGGGDTTLGWEATYANYRQKFPEGSMGTIDFKDLNIEMAGKESAIVTGRFDHQLDDKNVNGNFSLVVKLIDRQWKIINDHTSVAKE